MAMTQDNLDPKELKFMRQVLKTLKHCKQLLDSDNPTDAKHIDNLNDLISAIIMRLEIEAKRAQDQTQDLG